MTRLSFSAAMLGALVACKSPAEPPKTPTPEPKAAPTACPAAAPELAEDDIEADDRPNGLPVERICQYGSTDTRGSIERSLTLKVGQPLSLEDARRSLDNVAKLNLFEDVRIGAEASGNAAVVYVVVRERPQVEEVVYDPPTARPPNEANEVGIRPDPRALRRRSEEMEKALHQSGRGNARVSMTLEPTRPGLARLRVKVDLGPTWTIAKTSFPGASRVPESDLRSASSLTVGSPWDPEAIATASIRLAALYYERGFLTVKVEDAEQTVDSSGGVSLSWKIEEGESFTLSKLTFRGKLVDKKTQGELGALMKSRTRATFNRTVLVADIARIREFFEKRGKKIDVSPATDIDAKKKSVAVTLEINEP